MSETEKLRSMLDERGIEWRVPSSLYNIQQTMWDIGNFTFTTLERDDGLLVGSGATCCTAEQAIAATLGSGKLTAEQVRETVEKHWHDLPAEYDMPEATALPEFSYDWQEIADELNAMLLNATCEYCNGSKKPVNAEIGNDALITLHAIGDEYISDGKGPLYDVWRCSSCGYEYAESVSDESIVQNYCPNCERKKVSE